jgi:voltage-gated sodium channel
MILFCKRLSNSTLFHDFIVGVILLNTVLLGLETSQSIMLHFGSALHALNWIVQAIFIFEIAARVLACWPKPMSFFREAWDVFDFVVVAAAFLPVNGNFADARPALRPEGRLARTNQICYEY